MHPVLFSFGPITIYSYGLLFALGILSSLFYLSRQEPVAGMKKNQIIDLILLLTLLGVVGARMFFVIQNWAYYQSYPKEIFYFWEGGLVVYGGILSGFLGLLIFCRVKKVSLLDLSDLYFPALALAQSFGRIGCFLNGCCWGTAFYGSWAVQFPLFKELVHPTQIYSSVFNLCLFLLLACRYKRSAFKGEVTLLYFLLYPLGRFVLEIFRGDNMRIFFGMTIAQIICSFLILGTAVLYFAFFKKTKEVIAR